MKFTKLSVRRPVAMLMCIMMVLAFSGVALLNTPLELLPDFNFPMLAVITNYTGAGPSEVDLLITTPMEKILATVPGLKNIQSTSYEGMSLSLLEFEFGSDMDYISLQVREKIDMGYEGLPEGVKKPTVMSADPNAQPIIYIAISGANDRLFDVEQELIPQFERISGVASVSVTGGIKREITVELKEEAMAAYKLSSNALINAIATAETNLPLGKLKFDDKDLVMRGKYELASLQQLQELPIITPTGALLHLQDVAIVTSGAKPLDTISRLNGEESIMITIQKRQSANTLDLCRDVISLTERLNEKTGFNLEIIANNGTLIETSLGNVLLTLLIGAAISILVLCFFLGSFKTSLIIGVSIPIAVLSTFTLMYFSKMTLNIVSLGGFVIGVGMMVDSSIVVLESIFRTAMVQKDFKKAAIEGTQNVAGAVVASTLTTVAVFLPIVFMEGFAGMMFEQAALTITFSLSASLVVALTLVPSLYAIVKPVENMDTGLHRFLDKLDELYSKIIAVALRRKFLVMFVAIGLFIGSFAMIPLVGMELIAPSDQGEISVTATLPNGSNLDQMMNIIRQMEEEVKVFEDVKTYSTSYGMGMFSAGSSSVSMSVKLKSPRAMKTQEIAQQLRESLKDLMGAEISVVEMDSMFGNTGGAMTGTSISLYGRDTDSLFEGVRMVEEAMKKIDGIEAVTSTLSDGMPEARIEINGLKASAYGLTAGQIYQIARFATQGQKATDVNFDGVELDINVRYPKERFDSTNELQELSIPLQNGATTRMSQVADVVYGFGPVALNRLNSQKVMYVSGEIIGRDAGSVGKDITAAMSALTLPSGVTTELGGVQESMMEAFTSLLQAAILSLCLVFMIMAAQFESLRFSLVVMLSVPLAFTGGILGLVIGNDTLNITSFIGAIMLLGLVVNNAIVLIDCIEQCRRSGMERNEAIILAGRTRLRPILMTTLTTILSLLPLAFGIGSGTEIMRSMALVTIGGMTSSTMLTLVVIPVVYVLFDKKNKPSKRSRANKAIEGNALVSTPEQGMEVQSADRPGVDA